MTIQNKQEQVLCNSEYETLRKVILCEPKFMAIREVINETQKHYTEDNIDYSLAVEQHRHFTNALREHGIEVLLIPPNPAYPEQVFTRDIGFTIGHQICVSQMARSVRKGEEVELKKILYPYPFLHIAEGMIEGGDVLVHHHTVYIGVSSRTNKQAIQYLQKALPGYQIVPVPLQKKYLHLDCVFNILSDTEALYFPKALEKESISMLKQQFELIEVTEEEQFTLGTNVLSIGNKTVFSLPVNQNVNKQLKNKGYTVIEVDLSEIIKSGGSFRCCTLPILRR
ncbi:dimethylarginine dimethylaminohydrolase family protein [Lederbergia sp. NSJ-179]|uniref:dimethylarginine dimethylaminohydrolase family protein n=1 Tax=Lederbergia sp. NSJ-179 TaxID=2931402 RepID=UPI001FD41BFF|nr:dimethylarginine dimethylaminohydrolase family protein [Lederbergia sp. NSJ-179]MCJ7842016.1 dimethylarginine dimethylaminohydrolase family protein [Lederbergia sp. NSJ-179]